MLAFTNQEFSLFIPNFFILASGEVGFTPNIFAAPFSPLTFQFIFLSVSS